MSGSALRPQFQVLGGLANATTVTAGQLAAALRAADEVAERHRVAEGLVYAHACSRYRQLAGTEWKQVAEGDASWGGDSDHRYRERSRPDGSYDARCSCGAATVVFVGQRPDGTGDGPSWHTAHREGRIPGQVPGA